jgi:opacity protein-like surface antigen
MRTSKAFAAVLLAVLLASSACAPKYYAPNTHNVPLLGRDGDYSAAFAFGDSRGELQGAYAVTEDLSLMLNGAYFERRDDEEGDGGKGGLLEVGFGYQADLDERIQFGVFGLLGRGNVENHFPSTLTGNPGTTGVIEANLARYGVQPVIGFRSPYVEAAATMRIMRLRYSDVEGSLVFAGEDQVQLLGSQTEHTLLEPALTIRGGLPTVKLQLQLGWSVNKAHANFRQDEGHLTAAIVYSPR